MRPPTVEDLQNIYHRDFEKSFYIQIIRKEYLEKFYCKSLYDKAFLVASSLMNFKNLCHDRIQQGEKNSRYLYAHLASSNSPYTLLVYLSP